MVRADIDSHAPERLAGDTATSHRDLVISSSRCCNAQIDKIARRNSTLVLVSHPRSSAFPAGIANKHRVDPGNIAPLPCGRVSRSMECTLRHPLPTAGCSV
jgi:hypothetical protein